MSVALVPASRAGLSRALVRGFAHFGRAFVLAALAAQLVFVALSVDLVVRKDQPGDVVALQVVGLVLIAGGALVVRWLGGRVLSATGAAR